MIKILFKPLSNVYQLLLHLNKKLKRNFLSLLILILISSLLEIISITSIIPFLVSLSNIEGIRDNKYISIIENLLSIEFDSNQLILLFSFIFTLLVILNLLTKLFTLSKFKIFITNSVNYLSIKIFKNYFNQPFEYYYKNYV